MKLSFTVNGTAHAVDIDPMRRLLDVLRDDLGLKGTKEGCGEGECGACSVLLDGKLVNSCLVPIAQVDGAEVMTIDGFRETALGEAITQSFAEAHSVQCGFCTPGMVMAAGQILAEHPDPDEETIRQGLSGNICRCTGYDMIVDGVQLAARRISHEGHEEHEGGKG